MDKKKRWLFLTVFMITTFAVTILSTAIGTEYWIVSYPIRNVSEEIRETVLNLTGDLNGKFEGTVHLGLFNGYKILNHGYGPRDVKVAVECLASANLCGWVDRFADDSPVSIDSVIESYQNSNLTESFYGLFSFALWVVTLIALFIAVAWGLVAMAFSLINACTRPIDTITGPLGMYVWNIAGLLFCLLAVGTYLSLYFLSYTHNILTHQDRNDLWTSEGRTSLHFSFYLLILGSFLYFLNILIVALSGTECHQIRYGANINEKSMEGVMMY